MKRLVAPALALGFSIALVNSAWASGLFHNDCCEPCKPACAPACKPACKPACAPCARPACAPCARPACDTCDPCGRPHLGQRLVGWVKGLCHKDRCCEPCAGGAMYGPAGSSYFGPTEMDGSGMQPGTAPAPRLAPVPAEPMSMRPTRHILGR